MVFHVPAALVQLHRNFAQRIAFDEEHLQRPALVLGQTLEGLPESFASQEAVTKVLHCSSLTSSGAQVPLHVFEANSSIEVAGIQIAPAGNGTVVGHLEDPESGRPTGGIEQAALALDQEKDVLKQVVGLAGVSQDPVRHTTYNTGVTTEEQAECFPASITDLAE